WEMAVPNEVEERRGSWRAPSRRELTVIHVRERTADVSLCSSFLPRRALKTAVLPETALVDISVWVGLGIVGLRAALDVFAENVPSAMEVGTPRGHRRSELGRIRRLPSSLCSQRRGRDRCRMRARNSVATGFRRISGISVITPALRRVFWGTFR